jgi:leucyl/phenylalanyl-tRNA--protein transferase
VQRSLFRLNADPANFVARAENLIGRVGFFEAPSADIIVGKCLQGFVLFGRPNTASLFWRRFPARAIITRETAKIPRTVRSVQRRGELEVRYNQDLKAIISGCQEGRTGWLTPAIVNIYLDLQKLGLVAGVGTYRDGQLVGGLFGLHIGRVFSVTSLFHRESCAGVLAVAAVVEMLANGCHWSLVDFGLINSTWYRYGAREVAVEEFSKLALQHLH